MRDNSTPQTDQAVRALVAASNGRVLQQYGLTLLICLSAYLLICSLEESAIANLREQVTPYGTLYAATVPAAALIIQTMTVRLALSAWNQRTVAPQTQDPKANLPWGTSGYGAP